MVADVVVISVAVVFHFLVVVISVAVVFHFLVVVISVAVVFHFLVIVVSVTVVFHFLVIVVVSVAVVFHFLVVMFDNVLDMLNMMYRLGMCLNVNMMYRLDNMLDMFNMLNMFDNMLDNMLNMMYRLGSMTTGSGGMFDRMFSTLACSICNNWSIDFTALVIRIYNRWGGALEVLSCTIAYKITFFNFLYYVLLLDEDF